MNNLDDMLTIDNSEFEKHISEIYPTEIHLNKRMLLTKKVLHFTLDSDRQELHLWGKIYFL